MRNGVVNAVEFEPLLPDAVQAEIIQASENRIARRERQTVADDHPNQRHNRYRNERLHQHIEDIFGANHAAIKQRQSRRHQQNQGGRDQHPCRIALVNGDGGRSRRNCALSEHRTNRDQEQNSMMDEVVTTRL